jgi:hypothetical protein
MFTYADSSCECNANRDCYCYRDFRIYTDSHSYGYGHDSTDIYANKYSYSYNNTQCYTKRHCYGYSPADADGAPRRNTKVTSHPSAETDVKAPRRILGSAGC